MPDPVRDAAEADLPGVLAARNEATGPSPGRGHGASRRHVRSGSRDGALAMDGEALPPAPARAGHNGGPPLEEPDPNASWRLWCWKRARKRAWSAPREVALRRLARAEELGLTYREYALEIMERGRHL